MKSVVTWVVGLEGINSEGERIVNQETAFVCKIARVSKILESLV